MLFFRLCPLCSQSFRPHPRLADRQKCCGSLGCKRKQKALCQAKWKAKNKLACRENQQNWHQANPSYWRTYRELHPFYVQKNREQTKIRKSLSVARIGLQKRIDILQPPVDKNFLWDVLRFAKSPRSLTPLLYAKSLISDSLPFERPP